MMFIVVERMRITTVLYHSFCIVNTQEVSTYQCLSSYARTHFGYSGYSKKLVHPNQLISWKPIRITITFLRIRQRKTVPLSSEFDLSLYSRLSTQVQITLKCGLNLSIGNQSSLTNPLPASQLNHIKT